MTNELEIRVEISPAALELRTEISIPLEIKATLPQAVQLVPMKIASTDEESVYELITGDIDGENRDFTLPHRYTSGKLVVFYNGVQETDFQEVSPGAGTFQLGFAPEDGEVISAVYS